MNMLIFFLLFSVKTSFLVHADLTLGENTVESQVANQTVPNPQITGPHPTDMFLSRKDESGCSSLDDFPNLFTNEQRENGAIVIPFLVGIYCFTLIAIICDVYFIPCVERICEFLNLSQDVAAATFMAMATSAPELFINIIGTFVTESDVGIGTVVGASMFNTLGVAALGGLAAKTPIKVDWWPVSRDCFLYLLSITLLVVMTWDGLVYWYEGMVLFIVYFMYFAIMFNNTRISKICKRALSRISTKVSKSTDDLIKDKDSCNNSNSIHLGLSTPPIYTIDNEIKDICKDDKVNDETKRQSVDHPLKLYSELKTGEKEIHDQGDVYAELKQVKVETIEDTKKEKKEPTRLQRWFKTFMYIYMWPIKAFLYCLIPDPKTRPKLFFLTFFLCIVVIGSNSYVISWMVTVIGHTFGLSDTILGLTFLAAGACLPEAVSIFLVCRKGQGEMGVSNALGANTMNILLSLGLPWFIKTIVVGDGKSKASFIEITSGAIEYTILSLILVVFSLFGTLYFNNFKLQKKTGIILMVIYVIFLSCTIVSELLLIEPQPC